MTAAHPHPAPTAADLAALEAEIAGLTRVVRREARVLVVEDMQAMRVLLAQTLRELGFREIDKAGDGETAWRLVQAGGPDLVVSDWNLPRLDGLELLHRVRQAPGHRHLVFIMISGEHLDRLVMRAAEEDHDAYLSKPVSAAKLSRRLELVLDRRLTQARSRRLLALGRTEAAVEEFMAVAANHPRLAWPYLGLGGLLADLGRGEEAERCFSRVLELDPEAQGARLELARLQEARGQGEEARAVYRALLAQNPRYLRAHDQLAESLAAAGRPGEAAEVVQAALAQQGGDNAARQEQLSCLALAAGEPETAAKALVCALKLDPGRDPAANQLRLAHCRLALGELDWAITACQRAAAAAREAGQWELCLEAELLRGGTLLQTGWPEEGEAALERLPDPDAWPPGGPPLAPDRLAAEIAGCYLAAGLLDQARRDFARAIGLAEGDASLAPYLARVCLRAGWPGFLRGLPASAPPVDPAALANGESPPIPAPAEACARRGLALAGRGRNREAETAYRQGLAIAPSAARLHFNLAKLLLRGNRRGPGRESLAAATRLGLAQGDRELIAEVARLLEEMNFPDEAQALRRQAGVE